MLPSFFYLFFLSDFVLGNNKPSEHLKTCQKFRYIGNMSHLAITNFTSIQLNPSSRDNYKGAESGSGTYKNRHITK